MADFNYLIITNVHSASIHNANEERTLCPPHINCRAVAIACGNWYNERPFNGNREIRFLTYGGLQIADIRIANYQFENEDKIKSTPEVPVFIREGKVVNFEFQEGEKELLTGDFQFAKDTHWCDLFVHDVQIKLARADQKQSMKLIDWHGNMCFGGAEESWIAPYETHPNRPYVEWRLNPKREHDPIRMR